jgi:hypothetical protein
MRPSKLQAWASRAGLLGLGLVAMTVGLALGLVVVPSGCCGCGKVEPFEPGLFEITGMPYRPELVGGMVDASNAGVEISFTDADGNSWVIDYSITRKW